MSLTHCEHHSSHFVLFPSILFVRICKLNHRKYICEKCEPFYRWICLYTLTLTTQLYVIPLNTFLKHSPLFYLPINCTLRQVFRRPMGRAAEAILFFQYSSKMSLYFYVGSVYTLFTFRSFFDDHETKANTGQGINRHKHCDNLILTLESPLTTQTRLHFKCHLIHNSLN